MKALKKAISIFLATALTVGSVCVNTFAETAVQLKNKTWNMSEHETASNITASFEWNDLNIAATTEKAISFDGSYMKTSGGANVVKFKVAAPCNIKITAKNNGNSTVRYAVLSDGSNTLGKLELPITQKDANAEYSYSGLGCELSLAPSGGGISIKSISVEYLNTNNKKGDVNGDKNIDKKDASVVLSHILGIKTIDDAVQLAAANANNSGNVDMLDAIWILNNQYEEKTETTTTQTIDTSDGTVVSSYAQLVSAAGKSDAKVYITADIEMESRLQLSKGGVSLIGVPDENGILPVLNFENMTGTDIINSSSSDSDVGVRINSANNTVKNLIIEKAHDNGIQIKGTGATGNTVENCIVRYNNDSGIQVTGGATNNTLKCVYSYRNCDVYTRGGNADGFAIKLSAGPETTTDTDVMKANGNFMIDCYAWENGDDGWDSFDYPSSSDTTVTGNKQTAPDKWTYWLEYTNCMGWGNGDPASCMGYYDYINNRPLDEDLPFIRRFKAVYPDAYSSFVTSYNDGTLCSRTASASTYYNKLDELFPAINTDKGSLAPSRIADSDIWGGNPNCFKLGSKYTQSNSYRFLTNCIAFDHLANGVDRNNSAAIIYAENVMAFKNKINYHLSGYTAKEWGNIFGWSGASSNNLPTGGSNPSSSGSIDKEAVVRAAAERLAGYAADNKVIASNVFENVF